MAQLTIITETGMFHSACRCTWGQPSGWWGFKPRTHRAPMGPGLVDTSDRTASIKHLISFQVDDGRLRTAIDKVAADYATATYILTVRDCVSFSADVARAAGLSVPAVNITPYGFIAILAVWNQYTEWK
jgi:hypothetical protein